MTQDKQTITSCFIQTLWIVCKVKVMAKTSWYTYRLIRLIQELSYLKMFAPRGLRQAISNISELDSRVAQNYILRL